MGEVIVRCPACQAKNRVDRSRAERTRAKCSRCQETLEIPAVQTVPLDVTDATFTELVDRSPLPVLLAVWSPYCIHCQALDPVLRALTPEASQQLRVARLNLDENRGVAARYSVTATPTLLVLDRGREVDRMQGAQSGDQLRYRLHRYLRL